MIFKTIPTGIPAVGREKDKSPYSYGLAFSVKPEPTKHGDEAINDNLLEVFLTQKQAEELRDFLVAILKYSADYPEV